jgi:hypothetical protein
MESSAALAGTILRIKRVTIIWPEGFEAELAFPATLLAFVSTPVS